MGKLRLGTAVVIGSLLSVVAAQAADLRVKAPPQPVVMPPPFTWTGFYIGASLGAAWANADIDTSFGNTFGLESNARFIGGGQVGYNWQFDRNWLFGIEGAGYGIASNNNNHNDLFINGFRFNAFSNATWLATAAVRLGYVVDNWLIYAKGGGGWVGFDHRVNCLDVLCNGFSVSNSGSRGGWLAGGGIEWAFDRNWSAKVEYNFIGLEERDLGNMNGFVNGLAFRVRDPHVQTVTVGLNYLFH